MNYKEVLTGNLYHASSNTNLQEIHPNPIGSYENRHLVFAARLPSIAAIFLHNIGKDLTCRVEMKGNVPHLIERYAGAFETRYPEEPGAIYIVPPSSFSWARERFPEKQRWQEDYVSELPVTPIEKIYIPNVRAHIRELIDNGLISLQEDTKGKSLEQWLDERFTLGTREYQYFYESLSNPSHIKAMIDARKQVR